MAFPVDVRFVNEAGRRLGRALPLSYATRICRENGGDVSVNGESFILHPILDTTDRKRLSRSCNDIVRETASARSRPDFPPQGIAIGENGGGDLLVLLPDDNGPRFADTVYRWDHETRELEHVADTLEDLA
jgi:hypothetical protein